MGFGGLLMGVQQFPMMKMKWWIIKKNVAKAFALLCEHLTHAQFAHIQYCENVTCETLCDVHKTKTIKNKLFFQSRLFTIKMLARKTCLRTSTW